MICVDGVTWVNYQGGAAINGAADQATPVTHYFNPPFEARSVIINPQTWNVHISVRMEIYCKLNSGSGNNGPVNPLDKFFGKKVSIKSIPNDAFVRNNNGVIDLSASSSRRLEQWTVDAGNGNVYLKNEQFGKYLQYSAMSDDLTHVAKTAGDKTIEWKGKEIRPNVYTFGNDASKFLRALDTFDCKNDSAPIDDANEFEITII